MKFNNANIPEGEKINVTLTNVQLNTTVTYQKTVTNNSITIDTFRTAFDLFFGVTV